MSRNIRVGIFCTHPVQYFGPLYAKLADSPNIDLTVFYLCPQGAAEYFDAGFNRQLSWDTPILRGYESQFICDETSIPRAGANRQTWSLMERIANRIGGSQLDGLLLHGFTPPFGFAAIYAARRSGARLIFRSETHRYVPGALRRMAIRRQLFNGIDAFAAIGSWNRQYYIEHGVDPGRIHVTPYTVDVEAISADTDRLRTQRAAIRDSLGLAPDEFTYIYVGKMYRAKGVDRLLRAFAAIKHVKAALMLVGDGEDRLALEQQAEALGIRKRTIFCGFANQRELPRFYAAADAAVQPCDYGTWGLVINEALAARLPVIATAHMGAVGDLPIDGITGIVVPPHDEAALCEAMVRVSQDSALSKAAAEVGHASVMAWTFDRCAAAYADCFHIVAENRASPVR